MTATDQDFEIYKGEAKTLIIEVVDADGGAIELDGKTAVYRVSKKPKSTEFLIEMTDEDFEIFGSNAYYVPFVHDDTDELKAGEFYHELRVSNGSDVEVVVMTGKFTILDSNTNDVT